MSLSALAAAMAPKVKGSSTIGVKKSTVWTSARPGLRRYTPASSAFSKPTRRLGSAGRGRRASTWSKTFGLNFDAQPAALTCAVSFLATLQFRAFRGPLPVCVKTGYAAAVSLSLFLLPGGRPAPAPPSTLRQTFQGHNRFLNVLSFLAQIRQHF